MKNNCEKCNVELKQNGIAFICSYECTYCENCVRELKHICPNCKGELVLRPKRIQTK